MKIKNFNELATSDLRKSALEILEAGLAAIDTETVIKKSVTFDGADLTISGKIFSLRDFERILVVGAGKCSYRAAAALEEILGDKITDGIIIDAQVGPRLKKIKTFEGDHPLPTQRNVDATAEIIKLLQGRTKKDLVLVIVSGGGSTMLCHPDKTTCEQESILFKCLTSAGATIQEINTVRKHRSRARGGFLARYAYPAQIVSLIFMDIPGEDMEFVASGPTIKDTTTIEDALEIIKKYGIGEECGIAKEQMIETPKEDKYFERVENIVLVSNKMALEAMADKARVLGLKPEICTDRLTGEADTAAKNIAEKLDKSSPGAALLFGGETTVTIKGKGRGGRNQEIALAALSFIGADELIAPMASDGRDNTDFAGAICDIITKRRAEERGLKAEEFLSQNDSYNFFSQTGDFIKTGSTGSNVSDLIIALKRS